MAFGIPSTSRFGITLVNSEPGPKRDEIGFVNGGQGFRQRLADCAAPSRMRRMRERLLLILVSPLTICPFSNSASRTTLAFVEG